MKHLFNPFFFLFFLLAVVSACSNEEFTPPEPETEGVARFSHQVALQWNNQLLELERFTAGYRPTVSSRAIGYIGLAAYEAVQPGMADRYRSFSGYFPGLRIPRVKEKAVYHWPTVLNAAYAQILTRFFHSAPSRQLFNLYALEREWNEKMQAEIPVDVYTRSREYGREVAEAVYLWSSTDLPGHEGHLRNTDPSYSPPAGPGLWQPTYPDFSAALTPYWGQVRTFVADESDVCADPLPFSTRPDSEIFRQAREVQQMVNRIKSGELEEDHWIADFWSDDCPVLTFTPAGRWIAIANQVVAGEEVGLDKAVETYARVGMALADAGVRAWHEKYRFNYLRPVDYIQQVMQDKNWNTLMCPDGSGRFFTPPFPAYPSGHATFSAAAAAVLADLYGKNYQLADRCHEGRTEFRGVPRSFDSFFAMAEENGYSRLPIGVHFRMDSEAGIQLGYGIGRKVNALPWRR